MAKALPWLILVALAAGVWVARSCGPPRTPAGQRADSVLADTTFAVDTLRQDSVHVRLDSIVEAQAEALRQWEDSVAALTEAANRLQGQAQTVDAHFPLTDRMTASDSVRGLLISREMWRRSSLAYSQTVVPALQRQVEMATTARLTALALADTLRQQRDYARARANAVTREFQEYRSATREGVRLGPVVLPDWVDEVALVGGALVLGYKVGSL